MSQEMITVQFGATGVTEFNSAAFFLEALLDPNFSMELTETVVRLKESKTNYIELTGSFNAGAEGSNPLEYVNGITGYKVVVDGQVNYQVTGLDIDTDMLGSFKQLGKYLNDSDFEITGNNANNKLLSGSGDDVLNGGKGNDLLIANAGDDELTGGAGVDRFVFHKGDGVDTITDFVETGRFHETIDLSHFGEKLRFKDLDISREGKHDVSIDFGKGSDEIIIENASVKQITAADFNF